MSSSTETVLDQLNWRYATKTFDASKKLNTDQWGLIEASLHLSASSYGLQPWKFIVVQTPEIRAKLREASFGQGQITDASHLVVFTTLTTVDEAYVDRYFQQIAATRNVEVSSLDGYKSMIMGTVANPSNASNFPAWAQRQAYLAMGTLLTAAAIINVDTCPLEGLSPAEYDRILGLENSAYRTVAAVAVGFRSDQDKYQHAKKVRFPINEVIEYR